MFILHSLFHSFMFFDMPEWRGSGALSGDAARTRPANGSWGRPSEWVWGCKERRACQVRGGELGMVVKNIFFTHIWYTSAAPTSCQSRDLISSALHTTHEVCNSAGFSWVWIGRSVKAYLLPMGHFSVFKILNPTCLEDPCTEITANWGKISLESSKWASVGEMMV